MVSQKNPAVYGIVVGAGPKENEIIQLIRELNLEKKVFLAGLQTDTVSYFSAMDIFMMSSIFEGLPIALLEAMSMECAVVSTKAGGVVEAVREGKDGLLCEVNDWKSLGELALSVVEDPFKRKELQSAARKRVENSFSLASMVKDLETTYTDVYSGRTVKTK
ncbi:glycosyltransferase [Antarcticibacterium sp. 1MA-6-2]|uniref:glycosyltransferase n=1 Tax=Antarcticibacterium sp. 1MA-6-2 TaxID=2908210 RepID=UPI001F1F5C7D|nr:glycosyltransferase [Antarcticibacterium sp. 1MA-6-2]UJH91321.1 glycosyltransferase [Antarcticibacterium sp. 1MA-6-2]